ncbi:MAG TPA: metallophosphoesterase family protein [Gemmatimonadaceae bacterium]|nr:metallophosphoesterase family protein [Gemmatimonadaceae bacterium]
MRWPAGVRAGVRALAVLLVLLASVTNVAAGQRTDPAAVFLTWTGDPTSTVTVDWHLLPGADLPRVEIRGPGLDGWVSREGQSFPFPHSTRTVRRAELSGLRPDATYEIRFGDGTRRYRYRTMPARLTRSVRFAAGGDTRFAEEDFGRMNRVVAKYDLDFVVFGGDLSYANGDPRAVSRKEQWFETLTRTLVTADGRLIPALVGIGNHEVFSAKRFDDLPAQRDSLLRAYGLADGDSPYYTALFAQPRNHKYGVVDFGRYLSIVLLNTGHTFPVAGEQTAWLDTVLTARTAVPHVFPVYHVPAYPSVRSFDGATSRLVREHWVPLFEKHGVRLAFENHDHVYKRTIPLRQGKRDPNGIVFVGDGSWGVGPREIGRDHEVKGPAWYMETAISTNHGIIVTIDAERRYLSVVDADGNVIDEYAASLESRAPAAGTR